MIKRIHEDGYIIAQKKSGHIIDGHLPQNLLDSLTQWIESRRSDEEEKQKLVTEHASDEQALRWIEDFEFWRGGENYEVDKRLKHHDENGELRLYKVRQAHLSQEHQPPSIHTASLYLMIVSPGEEGKILPWEDRRAMQKELYKKGDKVTHKGFTWESMTDNNHWEPGATGVDERIWKKIS